jgi:hypothetical protein
MFKTIVNMAIGAFVAAAVSAAFAVVGTPPGTGPQLVDGAWLNGLAAGSNFNFQSGITAHAGGGQSVCQNLTPGVYLQQVDTVATTGDSVCLPFAVAGQNLSIRNNGANTANIFAQSATNGVTSALDTINNTTNTSAYTLSAQNIVECFVAKNGSWSCARGN